MKGKKNLENRIRGWLPKEPNLPSQNSPIQKPTKPKLLPKRELSVLRMIAGIVVVDFYMFSFLFQFSTLVIILNMITLAFAISWLLFRQMPHKNIIKFLRYSLIFVLLFVASFASVGFYLFHTSGYPSTYVPQITYPDILDLSLTPCLQNVEQSESFRFLKAEHFGRITFTGLIIRTSYSNAPGGLVWTFYAEDVNTKITIEGSSGYAYRTHSGTPLRDSPLPQNYPSPQRIKQSFDQIDALGLRWYYDQAVEAYQNTTTSRPAITDLGVDIAFNNQDNYQGITIILTGKNASHDNFGNKVYPTVFEVEFQPNGKILSATT